MATSGVYNLLDKQIPEFVRVKYPLFVTFMKCYYKFLAARGFGNLQNLQDIDTVCSGIKLEVLPWLDDSGAPLYVEVKDDTHGTTNYQLIYGWDRDSNGEYIYNVSTNVIRDFKKKITQADGTVAEVDDTVDSSLEYRCSPITTPSEVNNQKLVGHTIIERLPDNKGYVRAQVVGISQDNTLLLKYITKDRKFTSRTYSASGFISNVGSKLFVQTSEDITEATPIFEVVHTTTIPNVFLDNFKYMLDQEGVLGTKNDEMAMFVLRHIKDYYSRKGSEKSIEFLLRVLKVADSNVIYPWDKTFTVSGAEWIQHYSVVVKADSVDYITNIQNWVLNNTKNNITSYLYFNDYNQEKGETRRFSIHKLETFNNTKNERYIRIFLDRDVLNKSIPEPYYNEHITNTESISDLAEEYRFEGRIVYDIDKAVVVKQGKNWTVGQVFKIGGKEHYRNKYLNYDVKYSPWFYRKLLALKQNGGNDIDNPDNAAYNQFLKDLKELPIDADSNLAYGSITDDPEDLYSIDDKIEDAAESSQLQISPIKYGEDGISNDVEPLEKSTICKVSGIDQFEKNASRGIISTAIIQSGEYSASELTDANFDSRTGALKDSIFNANSKEPSAPEKPVYPGPEIPVDPIIPTAPTAIYSIRCEDAPVFPDRSQYLDNLTFIDDLVIYQSDLTDYINSFTAYFKELDNYKQSSYAAYQSEITTYKKNLNEFLEEVKTYRDDVIAYTSALDAYQRTNEGRNNLEAYQKALNRYTEEYNQYTLDHAFWFATREYTVSPLINVYEDDNITDTTEYDAIIKFTYNVIHKDEGYWKTNKGATSDNGTYIQDSYYYQKFSYDIQSNLKPEEYEKLIEFIHPVGTKKFFTYNKEDFYDMDMDIDTDFPIKSAHLTDMAVLSDFMLNKLIKKITTNGKDYDIIKQVNDLYKKSFNKTLHISFNVWDTTKQRINTFKKKLGVSNHTFYRLNYGVIPSRVLLFLNGYKLANHKDYEICTGLSFTLIEINSIVKSSDVLRMLTSTIEFGMTTNNVYITPISPNGTVNCTTHSQGSTAVLVFKNRKLLKSSIGYHDVSTQSISIRDGVELGEYVDVTIPVVDADPMRYTFSESEDHIINAGERIPVPEHIVGSNTVWVFLDGRLCTPGVDYYSAAAGSSSTSTVIYFKYKINYASKFVMYIWQGIPTSTFNFTTLDKNYLYKLYDDTVDIDKSTDKTIRASFRARRREIIPDTLDFTSIKESKPLRPEKIESHEFNDDVIRTLFDKKITEQTSIEYTIEAIDRIVCCRYKKKIEEDISVYIATRLRYFHELGDNAIVESNEYHTYNKIIKNLGYTDPLSRIFGVEIINAQHETPIKSFTKVIYNLIKTHDNNLIKVHRIINEAIISGNYGIHQSTQNKLHSILHDIIDELGDTIRRSRYHKAIVDYDIEMIDNIASKFETILHDNVSVVSYDELMLLKDHDTSDVYDTIMTRKYMSDEAGFRDYMGEKWMSVPSTPSTSYTKRQDILKEEGEWFLRRTQTENQITETFDEDLDNILISSWLTDLVINHTYTPEHNIINAGTPYNVPVHDSLSTTMLVFLDGVLCCESVDYTVVNNSSITFTKHIRPEVEIEVYIVEGKAVKTSISSPTSSTITVPNHSVGTDAMLVYIDGSLCDKSLYTDAFATSISLNLGTVMTSIELNSIQRVDVYVWPDDISRYMLDEQSISAAAGYSNVVKHSNTYDPDSMTVYLDGIHTDNYTTNGDLYGEYDYGIPDTLTVITDVNAFADLDESNINTNPLSYGTEYTIN